VLLLFRVKRTVQVPQRLQFPGSAILKSNVLVEIFDCADTCGIGHYHRARRQRCVGKLCTITDCCSVDVRTLKRPIPAIIISMTIARRSDSKLRDVRSVESFSEASEMFRQQYRPRWCFASHGRQEPIVPDDSVNVGNATRTFAAHWAGFGNGKLVQIAQSSLSMEHQRRFLISRVDSSVAVAGPWIR